MSNDRFRGLKAVLKTALTWGILLGATVTVIAVPLILLFPGGGDHTFMERVGLSFFAAVGLGIRLGIFGGIIGLLFATAVRFSYRGKRLADLSIGRFALLGGVVGGVGVPLVYQLLNILSGGAIPWKYLLGNIPFAAFVGAAAAAGSIWMARRAAASGERDPDRLDAPAPFEDTPALRTPERTSAKPRD
jgi:hypothetical protein